MALGRGDEDAAARGAVELGHHEAGDPRDLAEDIDLRQRILPRRRVEDEHDIVRRGGVEAAEDALDLGELVHQLALVLKAPGGVDDQHVDAGRGRLLDRVEHDPRRVAALGPGHDRDAKPFGPDLELPDRGGAEGVARDEHHAIILFLEQVRELGDGGGLARSVDADHENDLRTRKGVDVERFGDGAQHRGDFLGDDLAQFLGAVRRDVTALGQAVADARGHGGAEVGGDQRILDAVEIVVVEARLAGDARQILAEPLRRALEAAEQPFAPAKPAHAASILSPSRAVRRTGTMLPGSAGVVSVSAAKFSA